MDYIIVGWALCGFISACILYAHFQKSWTEQKDSERTFDTFFSIIIGLFGPMGLIFTLIILAKYRKGFKIPGTK